MSDEAVVWVTVGTAAVADVVAEICGYSDECPGLLWRRAPVVGSGAGSPGGVLMTAFDVVPDGSGGHHLEMMLHAGRVGRWGEPERVIAEVHSDQHGWRWRLRQCPASLGAPEPELSVADAEPALTAVVGDLADRIIDGITRLVNQQLRALECCCSVKHVELRERAIRLGVAIRAAGATHE